MNPKEVIVDLVSCSILVIGLALLIDHVNKDKRHDLEVKLKNCIEKCSPYVVKLDMALSKCYCDLTKKEIK